jgi:hypothetical protein
MKISPAAGVFGKCGKKYRGKRKNLLLGILKIKSSEKHDLTSGIIDLCMLRVLSNAK